MIYINDKSLDKIKGWKDDTIHILADFDRTITEGNSNSSWSILSKSEKVPKEYVEERQKLYDFYRPIEIDEEMDFSLKNKLMTEWWHKHINLLIKYQMSEEVIKESANNLRIMKFRNGAKEFLVEMNRRNIPIVIISAGIGNFIKEFLINNDCNFSNIYIVSNFIKFENGIAVGIEGNVTHSMNKNEVFLSNELKEHLKNRPNIILLGDQISDVLMAPAESRDKSFKIGFLDEKIEDNLIYYCDNFDIVGTDNTSYTEIFDKIGL